jgi:hypothetical protein
MDVGPTRLPACKLFQCGGEEATCREGFEATAADLWATSVSPDSNPVEYLREYLDKRGALTAGQLAQDETGMANVLVSPRLVSPV